MEAKLFSRLKESMMSFNLSEQFDIPTGQYVEGGLKRGEFITYAGYPRKTGPNYAIIGQLMAKLEKLKPATPERIELGCRLLRYMGYSVTLNGDNEQPTVHWSNTEGNGDAEAKMIDDIFNRDYLSEPRTDVSNLNGSEFYAKMQEILNGDGATVIIDSISQESTDPS